MKDKNIDSTKKLIEYMESTLGNYYDRTMMNVVLNQNSFFHFGKIIGYKNVKEPIYFTIKVPIIEKHYNYDECGDYEEEDGFLITTKEIKLFKIGTKIVKKPIYEERKDRGMIKFRRYSPLKQKKIIKKGINKLKNKFEP